MLSGGGGTLLHGPFHRLRNATTQSDAVALLQQQSQEVWGRAARWSSLRSVKAYVGSLPINAEGIEFMTFVAPSHGYPHNVFWYEGTQGVTVNSQGYVVISATIVKKVP
jgi:hypothetical protein